MELLITHTLDSQYSWKTGPRRQWLTLYAPDGVSATIFGDLLSGGGHDKVQQFYGNDFLLNEQYETAGELTDEGRVTDISPPSPPSMSADGRAIDGA